MVWFKYLWCVSDERKIFSPKNYFIDRKYIFCRITESLIIYLWYLISRQENIMSIALIYYLKTHYGDEYG